MSVHLLTGLLNATFHRVSMSILTLSSICRIQDESMVLLVIKATMRSGLADSSTRSLSLGSVKIIGQYFVLVKAANRMTNMHCLLHFMLMPLIKELSFVRLCFVLLQAARSFTSRLGCDRMMTMNKDSELSVYILNFVRPCDAEMCGLSILNNCRLRSPSLFSFLCLLLY